MGWWIALGVIFLLGILPLGISARYSGEGPLLRVVIGPVRLTLFPRKKKEKKPKPAKKTAELRPWGIGFRIFARVILKFCHKL